MIQFNLLPDVKIEFMKLQHIKRLVMTTASLLSIVSLLIFILLFSFVDIAQKKHLNDLSKNISTTQAQLGNTSNLNKILTIQNQLETLPSLDAQKPVATRLFNDLVKITPATATISQIAVNFTGGTTGATGTTGTTDTIQLQGNAPSLTVVNQYVDTLKFTTYNTTAKTTKNAFSSVVLSSFGVQAGKGVSYTINLNFDPAIFAVTNSGNLTVPNIITTRSITDQPTDLFKDNSTTTNGATTGSTP